LPTTQFKRDYKREAKGLHRATLDADMKPVLQVFARLHRRFRGTAEWSRCGALTALMLLAPYVHVLRKATRLRSGSTVIALYTKRQFSKINLCCGGQYALLPATEASLSQR
jgi:hypothetical protein